VWDIKILSPKKVLDIATAVTLLEGIPTLHVSDNIIGGWNS
jgi:hypothetical protein